MKKLALTALTLALGLGTSARAEEALHSVLVVGNSAAGTVSILDEKTFANLGLVNVIPDLEERMNEINGNLLHRIFYGLIRNGSVLKHYEPGDGTRYVDDVYLSPKGDRMYVSRAGLGDVAAFDLTKPGAPMVWRADIPGFKADHAALSPDGKRFVVSASLARKAIVFRTKDGSVYGSFKTGNVPHQNDYSHDGKHIYNASLGLLDQPYLPDWIKGPRRLTIADANTLKVVKQFDFKRGVRPAVITPDERYMYAQLSFLNGVIKFDLETGKEVARVKQKLNDFAKKKYPTREDYPHESVRHGLALSGDGTKLCDAGTISNEISIVSTANMKVEASIDTGAVPYWSTTSSDGNYCFVSLSGDNAVSVIDYHAMKEVARIPVGLFPQRNRVGKLSEKAIQLLGH